LIAGVPYDLILTLTDGIERIAFVELK